MKAKSSFNKLSDRSQVISEIEKINADVPMTHLKQLHAQNSKNGCNNIDLKISQSNSSKSRKKKNPFSNLEDGFTRKGVVSYGQGRWTSIINDPEYKFHPSRQPATLVVRAKN